MNKTTPEIEALAAERLAADEERITGQARRRQSLSLGAAWAEFWKHPSPWMISTFRSARSWPGSSPAVARGGSSSCRPRSWRCSR